MTKVLIIEDEAILARNLAVAMQRSGIEADIACSAKDARICLADGSAGLICADISLGDGDGIDLVSDYRTANPSVPVVIMTGQDSVANRLRAEQLDATAFLAKPFAMSRFRELVLTLLNEGNPEDGPGGRSPSVLMYSHDTIGLGHMRRNSAIAGQIVSTMPGASVLMVVGCPTGVPFDLEPGIDFIKLPSLSKVGPEKWHPSSLRISSVATRSLRGGLLQRSVEAFCPDVLLVDHEPAGVWDELVPILRALRKSNRKTRVILGLRDILDDPDSVRARWQRHGIAELIRDCYDDVLIYGDERLYPAGRLYGLDDLLPGRIHYCGYVTVVPPRTDMASPREGGVVVSGGGGRDAFPLLAAALNGLEKMPRRRRPAMSLIAGPLMDEELYESLRVRAAKLGARMLRSTHDVPALLRDAALFISMAGYNSLTEAIALGCPTLVIPRVGPSAEQRLRASMMAREGLVEALSIAESTPEVLAWHFARLHRRGRPLSVGLPLDGAAKAASFIVRALSNAHPDRPLSVYGELGHA